MAGRRALGKRRGFSVGARRSKRLANQRQGEMGTRVSLDPASGTAWNSAEASSKLFTSTTRALRWSTFHEPRIAGLSRRR